MQTCGSLIETAGPGQAQISLSEVQTKYLMDFADRVNRRGANFLLLDTSGRPILVCDRGGFRSSIRPLAQLVRRMVCSQDPAGGQVARLTGPTVALACPVDLGCQGRAVAVIDMGDPASVSVTSGLAVPAGRPELAARRECLAEMLGSMALALGLMSKMDRDMEVVGNELAQAYEELVLLHRLGTHMALTEKDKDFLEMICQNMIKVVPVEGLAAVVAHPASGQGLVAAAQAGPRPVSPQECAAVWERLARELELGHEALVDGSLLRQPRYAWPDDIRSIVAVPLLGREPASARSPAGPMLGLLVAVNCLKRQEFDSTDIKLLSSVAGGCGVFLANGRLFGELRDLLLGVLLALAQSIDAKDQYTRGHSERVAFISRWIAEHLHRRGILGRQEVHSAYFAGLLHDIGKIGVDDWILRKDSSLTQAEWSCIHRHPVIGAGILRQVRQMKQIVPAVMSHHERVDGRGYPQGLRAGQIPIMAKVVGLADSFDAITSDRSYRPAKTVQQALEEIRTNTGTQFDQEVAAAFLESDLDRLWGLLGPGADQLYYNRGTSCYAAEAVEALVR